DRMTSGGEDSQWIEVEGIIHSAAVTADKGYLTLAVAASGGRVTARIPNFHQTVPAGFVDATVRLTGVCAAIFNKRNQLTGVLLLIPSLSHVKLKEKPPADPFTLPVRPISSLMRFTPSGASGHRVRVQGTVTVRVPG